MKKAILIAFPILFLGSLAFADGKWTAWNQGDFFPYFQTGANAATNGWGPTWDNIKGIDQEWTFAYEAANYGFDATLEFGMDNFGNTGPLGADFVPPSLSWFGTWYKFFDVVKLEIGKPRISDYTVFSVVEGTNFKRFGDSDFMAMVQVLPIPGLSFAGALYVQPQDVFTGTRPLDYGNNFGAAASYALPDNVLKVVADYRASTSGAVVTKKLDVGVSTTPMAGITAAASYEVDLSNTADLVHGAWVSGGWTMEPLSIGLDVLTKMDNTVFAWAAEAKAEYTFSKPFGAGVKVGYDNGNGANLFDQGSGQFAGFMAWPYLIANFDNGSYVQLGFIYSTGAAPTATSAAIEPGADAANQTMAVALYYSWAF